MGERPPLCCAEHAEALRLAVSAYKDVLIGIRPALPPHQHTAPERREYKVSFYVTVDASQLASDEAVECLLDDLLTPLALGEVGGIIDTLDMSAEDLGEVDENGIGARLRAPTRDACPHHAATVHGSRSRCDACGESWSNAEKPR